MDDTTRIDPRAAKLGARRWRRARRSVRVGLRGCVQSLGTRRRTLACCDRERADRKRAASRREIIRAAQDMACHEIVRVGTQLVLGEALGPPRDSRRSDDQQQDTADDFQGSVDGLGHDRPHEHPVHFAGRSKQPHLRNLRPAAPPDSAAPGSTTIRPNVTSGAPT